MRNPFLFYSESEHKKDNLKATRETKKLIERFTSELRGIVKNYSHIGADDTQSREMIGEYIIKKIKNGEII